MNNIKDLFPEFYQKKLEDASMINSSESIIVIDTNYLLNILELPISLAKKYMNALEKVSKNIYVPYLVALEFNFNKSRIKKQKNKKIKEYKINIEKNIDKIKSIIEDNELITSKEILEKHKSGIIPIIDTFKNNLLNHIEKNLDKFLIDGEDIIYGNLISFLGDKVGNEYSKEWIEESQKEAESRFENNIPPGNDDISKDSEKDSIRYYNGFSYHRKYGDYIIWRDILEYSSSVEGKSRLIFVTSDGTSKKKKDLYYKVDGLVVGPQIYLLNELKLTSKLQLYIIDNSRFVNLIEQLTKDEILELERIERIKDKRRQAKLGKSKFSKSIMNIIERNNKSENEMLVIDKDGYYRDIDLRNIAFEKKIPEEEVEDFINIQRSRINNILMDLIIENNKYEIENLNNEIKKIVDRVYRKSDGISSDKKNI